MELDNYIHGVTSSADTDQLDMAGINAMKEYKPVAQSGENKFAKFRYETQTDIMAATVPALLNNGLSICFSPGFHAAAGEVMVGRISHPKSKQWISAVVPLIYPHNPKTGEVQHDGQGAETADTYARKRLLRSLTACWVEGAEVVTEQEHDRKMAADAHAEHDSKKKKKSNGAPLIEKIRTAMLMLKGSPEALKEKLAKAEQCCVDGLITEEQLKELQKEFSEND